MTATVVTVETAMIVVVMDIVVTKMMATIEGRKSARKKLSKNEKLLWMMAEPRRSRRRMETIATQAI